MSSPRTGAVTETDPHRLPAPELERHLEAHLEGFQGPLAITKFEGGQSNPTYLLETPRRRYVLRKKPPGKLLPSAHRIEREFQVQKALAGSGVPVPEMLLLEEEERLLGTGFYVMSHVAGRVFTDPALPGMAPGDRRLFYLGMARTLAQLHRLEPRALGLENYGRPEGFVRRQIERWSGQYRAGETEPIAAMEQLIAELPGLVPQREEVAIVHGDYRLGNVMMGTVEPSVAAVLDWELSTLGHPLADLAYLVMFHHLPNGREILGGVAGLDLSALGIPPEEELIATYAEAAGRGGIGDWEFFLAFSLFRLAAIAQGVYARGLSGNAADRRAHGMREVAVEAAELGAGALDRN